MTRTARTLPARANHDPEETTLTEYEPADTDSDLTSWVDAVAYHCSGCGRETDGPDEENDSYSACCDEGILDGCDPDFCNH